MESAVAAFGVATRHKLSSAAAQGEPEDQLRGPLEVLLTDLAELCGLAPARLTLVGESSLAQLRTRPDFAVAYAEALIGYVEVKAPGKGADPRRFREAHDRDQWKKLSALPNLLYTDGNSFALWRGGELVGRVQHLDGDVETSGVKLRPGRGLLEVVDDFLRWQPIPPKTPRQLAQTTARLCRLLRARCPSSLTRETRR